MTETTQRERKYILMASRGRENIEVVVISGEEYDGGEDDDDLKLGGYKYQL